MYSCSRVFFSFALIIASSFAAQAAVKLADNGICHDESSVLYSRTKASSAFDSIEACLLSGGQLSKKYVKHMNKVNKPSSSIYYSSDWRHWIDSDNDCQNTREEILITQSLTAIIFDTPDKCSVDKGKWYDPYSGKTFIDDDALDVDHIVPLGFTHTRNGGSWSEDRKEQFANDPQNLIAVDKSLNREKREAGPLEWMPPNHHYRCEYLQRFDAIMRKYDLQFFPSEKRIVDKMIAACP